MTFSLAALDSHSTDTIDGTIMILSLCTIHAVNQLLDLESGICDKLEISIS